MPLSSESIAGLVAAVGRDLSAVVEVDAWAPTVQGAVGHVLGVRGADGSSYVLKAYGPHGSRRAATEVLALHLLGAVAEIPVPRVLLQGALAGGEPLSYVLMSRLPGVRWADRRAGMNAQQSLALHRGVGQLLCRMHVLSRAHFGDLSRAQFGDLLHDGPRWPTAWARIDARCDQLVGQHLHAGGPVELGHRVRRLVNDHRDALGSCVRPVLCHNDFIDGNLLVATTGEPRLCGVVDLERASWDDPLADLARTKLHARYHDPAAAEVLVKAYGVHSDDEHHRVAVHEVLHAMDERTWIQSDRPTGWKQSIAALDAFLMSST
ncbi:MAG: aminoglycoside phosphotransferase family protein [Actinomycetota bacterium]|nr:aminoglycoside phosphotransferase family protein [Actinomycetota bacterium]